MTDTPEAWARRLLDELTHRGAVSQRMAAALRAVPRHLFIPDTIYRHERGRAGNDLVPIHRGEHPAEWLRLVYADEPVNTQVDDGQPGQDGTGWEVTSSSQPSVVAGMLDELHPQPGDRVLEIGTGTGWHAALLAHLLGPENVTSIEVDSTIAERARAALDQAGHGKVTVITGDGAAGHPDRAPYNRVIATVGVARVPYPWVEQTRAGGRLVAPLTGDYQPPGVVALTTHGDGTASGRLGTLWLYAAESRSWASLELLEKPPYPVRHAGPRAVFDEVVDAYHWWRDAGEPATNRWLVTVADDHTAALNPAESGDVRCRRRLGLELALFE